MIVAVAKFVAVASKAQAVGKNYLLYHRRPKLTMRGIIFFFNLYANIPCTKHDTVTADIYYYITTEFGYAKCDLRLAAYDGVVLQLF